MYPVPSLSCPTVTWTSGSSAISVKIEYMQQPGTLPPKMYTTVQKMASHLRPRDQFSGSLGSSDGVGISTMPDSVSTVSLVWSRSTRWEVPGTAEKSISVCISKLIQQLVGLESLYSAQLLIWIPTAAYLDIPNRTPSGGARCRR